MAEKSTFIKLDRNIIKWRWYQNANTFRVFIHLLINANIDSRDFEQATINRGELATSYNSIANDLNLSIKSVRIAVDHLKRTGEVAVRKYPKFQVVTILKYDTYQTGAGKTAGKGQAEGRQRAGEGQQLKNIRIKEEKNIPACAQTEEDGVALLFRNRFV